MNDILDKFFVPMFGNRKSLEWESDRKKQREWLEKYAGLKMPREIRPEEFVAEGIYSEDEVRRDLAYVKKREEGFKADMTQEGREALIVATVFEAIIHSEGELSEWFGPRSHTIKPSRYDDLSHGVDEIVEIIEDIEDDETIKDERGKDGIGDEITVSRLALAIDVTMSEELGVKLERIKDEIRGGRLATVKYFKSEVTGFAKGLEGIPRIVIGADGGSVKDLADLWLNKDSKDPRVRKESKDKLSQHPIQFQILEEMLFQLRVFGDYARQVGRSDISRSYYHAAGLIENILRDKKKTGLEDKGERDAMFENLRDRVNMIFLAPTGESL